MDTLLIVASIYLLYGIPVVVGGLLVWLFAGKRLQLHASDWLLLVAPFGVWLIATAVHDGDKSLSNVVESFFLGCITALLFATRAILTVAADSRQARLARAALAGSCVTALVLWAFVPGLPE